MQLIAIEYFAVERLFLMADNRCADSIACDVDCGAQHIENTVDTHDKSDTSVGSPTEFSTIARVTSPTLGIPAVPMEASVAVTTTVARFAGVR